MTDRLQVGTALPFGETRPQPVTDSLQVGTALPFAILIAVSLVEVVMVLAAEPAVVQVTKVMEPINHIQLTYQHKGIMAEMEQVMEVEEAVVPVLMELMALDLRVVLAVMGLQIHMHMVQLIQ